MAYIYFDFKEQEQQRPIRVLGSLAKQLAYQAKYPHTEIEGMHDRLEHQGKKPSTDELYASLLLASKSFSYVFLVFDALDECDPIHRKELLLLFHRMGSNGVNLFVTSRQYPEDIRVSFNSAPTVELLTSEEDIRAFIQERIDEDPRARRLVLQGSSKDRIISELIDCAKGM